MQKLRESRTTRCLWPLADTASHFQRVTAAEEGNAIPIDFSQLNLIAPDNGVVVHFTVVAVNSHGESIPTPTDTFAVQW
jgi:hypothetical protein